MNFDQSLVGFVCNLVGCVVLDWRNYLCKGDDFVFDFGDNHDQIVFFNLLEFQ